MLKKDNFFVFSGGPGVGKTTLLRHLAGLGERIVEETARSVIREEQACGGSALPWIDPAAFARACAQRDIARFDELASHTGRVFFDRGIMDSHGVEGAPPWPDLIAAIQTHRYNKNVFVFPPWREIYETDAERRQDWSEAERTFEVILGQLPGLGYQPVIVPKASLAERADFVLKLALQASPSPQ